MPTIFQRKVLKIGDSIGITLPDNIMKTYDIEPGMKIWVISDALEAHGLLIVDILGRDKKELWKLLNE